MSISSRNTSYIGCWYDYVYPKKYFQYRHDCTQRKWKRATDLWLVQYKRYREWHHPRISDSEKFKDPGSLNSRIDFWYDSIKYALKGYWNYRLDNTNLPIPSLAYIVTDKDTVVNIYTVESQGYRTIDPTLDYTHADIVNTQEGLNLEYKGEIVNGYTARFDAFTAHPTVFKWIDGGSPRLFPIPANLQYAVSGNFIGDGKSEIMLFYKLEKSNKRNN